MNAFIHQTTSVNSTAVTPEQAAEILGWPVTKGRGYTRRLKYCREKGYLRTFYNFRPYHYDRKEVEALREKLREGKVLIPSL